MAFVRLWRQRQHPTASPIDTTTSAFRSRIHRKGRSEECERIMERTTAEEAVPALPEFPPLPEHFTLPRAPALLPRALRPALTLPLFESGRGGLERRVGREVDRGLDAGVAARLEGGLEGRVERRVEGRVEGRVDERVEGRVEGGLEGGLDGWLTRGAEVWLPGPLPGRLEPLGGGLEPLGGGLPVRGEESARFSPFGGFGAATRRRPRWEGLAFGAGGVGATAAAALLVVGCRRAALRQRRVELRARSCKTCGAELE